MADADFSLTNAYKYYKYVIHGSMFLAAEHISILTRLNADIIDALTQAIKLKCLVFRCNLLDVL